MEDRKHTDPSALTLRRATVADAPTLARVHADSWRAAYRDLVPAATLQGFTYERREQRFRRAMEANSEETYLVYLGETIVGILTLGAARDADLDVARTGEIWGIYLSPDYWRHGIGRRLVIEAEQMLAARGYSSIILWVLRDNQQARRFYEAMGFALDGASRDIDWGTVLKAVRYSKALPAR